MQAASNSGHRTPTELGWLLSTQGDSGRRDFLFEFFD